MLKSEDIEVWNIDVQPYRDIAESIIREEREEYE